jgi:hypothetical protein
MSYILRYTSVSPVSIIPSMLHVYLHLHTTHIKKTSWRNLKTFQQNSAAYRRPMDRNMLSRSLRLQMLIFYYIFYQNFDVTIYIATGRDLCC